MTTLKTAAKETTPRAVCRKLDRTCVANQIASLPNSRTLDYAKDRYLLFLWLA